VSDRYLWDKSGEVDPEIEALERALAPLAHRGGPLRPETRRPRRRWPLLLAAAAALAVAFVTWQARPPSPAWDVERLAGAPRVGARPLTAAGRLAVGQTLETDAASRARVSVSDIGRVDVEPNTRMRLVGTSPKEHRLALDRGAIHAVVSAPPRLFLVETPAALAVDLGCAYTLEVDPAGGGLLRVTAGFVSLERGARSSYVPAGAVCRMRPSGPGTPWFADASAALQAALDAFDFAGDTPPALDAVLARTRPEDSLTLWHLLIRAQPEDRGRVYDRLARILAPPAGVTRDGLRHADAAMLASWRDVLEPLWAAQGADSMAAQERR
jgi:hypothetical protein